MYLELTKRFREALRTHVREKYDVDIAVGTERPPKIELGDAASPLSFELAKRLKRAPRQIAQEIATSLAPIVGIAKVEVAGAGYLNAHFDRTEFWQTAQRQAETGTTEKSPQASGKIIVEHTSINPNKAAHIGHVRNAVLGDTTARILRHSGGDRAGAKLHRQHRRTSRRRGHGFVQVEKKNLAEVRALAAAPKFDYLCWDVYARAATMLSVDKARAGAPPRRNFKSR